VKLLVLTPEPIDAALLRSALGEDVKGAEVPVVSPASNHSKVAFWVSDDALATFAANRIVIFSHLEGERLRSKLPHCGRNRHMQGIVQFGRRQSPVADKWE
jgi:hypothetical protein